MDTYQQLITQHHHSSLVEPTIDDPLKAKDMLERIVVGVDPAMSHNGDSNETGIIVAGLSFQGIGYVLDDLSGQYAPSVWAAHVISAYKSWKADRVVAEINQGGDLVETMLRSIDKNVSYRGVRATRGKRLRAEPIAALYEQGRIFHLSCFEDLEKQLCAFDGTTSKSTDRLDALVWAFTDLMIDSFPPKKNAKKPLPQVWHI